MAKFNNVKGAVFECKLFLECKLVIVQRRDYITCHPYRF